LTDVVIPERNRADLEDVPQHVRDEITFHPVISLDEVLDVALEPRPAHASAGAA
jgi:ATP-dependent Lon protease